MVVSQRGGGSGGGGGSGKRCGGGGGLMLGWRLYWQLEVGVNTGRALDEPEPVRISVIEA